MLLKISSAKWQPFCPGGDELAPARWQVITCINVDLLTTSSLEKQWNLNQNSTIITQEKAFENVVYKRWPFFHAAINRPISQIPQCIKQLSHNAPFCNIVHISVTKWCIVGYGTDALWDLWDWLLMERVFPWSLDLPSLLLPLAVHGIQGTQEAPALLEVLSLLVVRKVLKVLVTLAFLEIRRNQVSRQVLEVLAVLWTQWR